MVDKLKKWGWYIAVPFVFVAGLIFYLFTKNDALLRKVAGKEADEKLRDYDERIRNAANDTERARLQYEKSRLAWREGRRKKP